MTKKEVATEIARILDQLYPRPPIPLNHVDPFSLLVSVLLSAQSTDVRVNQVTPDLFLLADNPQEMMHADVEQVQAIIRPVGLSARKAKAIVDLSRILVEKHAGEVPADMEALEELPGVGHKTASVVMSQAFDIPAFPVDTHIHRLAWRWKLSTGKHVVKTEADLKRIFPIESWNKLHLQIIFFGREYCPSRGHNPYKCPICSRFGRKTMMKEWDAKHR